MNTGKTHTNKHNINLYNNTAINNTAINNTAINQEETQSKKSIKNKIKNLLTYGTIINILLCNNSDTVPINTINHYYEPIHEINTRINQNVHQIDYAQSCILDKMLSRFPVINTASLEQKLTIFNYSYDAAKYNNEKNNIAKSEYYAHKIHNKVKDFGAFNDNNIKNEIAFYVSQNKDFADNSFYKSLRLANAHTYLNKIICSGQLAIRNNMTLLYVDKTFQKFMVLSAVYSGISEDKNINDANIEFRLAAEYDCSTAKIPGKKQRHGDGKTPEGIFTLQSVEPSSNKLYEGLKAYGPYFVRVYGSIGLHGNGTDSTKTKNWRTNKAYMPPDPLGIIGKKFGQGVSHGCIRLDNNVIKELVESGIVQCGQKIVIYEDNNLTAMLCREYSKASQQKPTIY
jgi:lipoprotein-anchoring transpeptidase ErfK/SrfK